MPVPSIESSWQFLAIVTFQLLTPGARVPSGGIANRSEFRVLEHLAVETIAARSGRWAFSVYCESDVCRPDPGSHHSQTLADVATIHYSPEGSEFEGGERVLSRESCVTAEEEPHKTKQDKGWHEPRFLAYIVMKVKPLRAYGLLAIENGLRPTHTLLLAQEQAMLLQEAANRLERFPVLFGPEATMTTTWNRDQFIGNTGLGQGFV